MGLGTESLADGWDWVPRGTESRTESCFRKSKASEIGSEFGHYRLRLTKDGKKWFGLAIFIHSDFILAHF